MAEQKNNYSLEEVLQQYQRLTPEQLLHLGRAGIAVPGKELSSQRIQETLDAIGPIIVQSNSSGENKSSLEEDTTSAFYLLRIYDPANHVFYITLLAEGKVLITTTDEGKLDYSHMFRDDSLLLTRLVEAGLSPELKVVLKKGGHSKGKEGGSKGKEDNRPRTKEKPGYVFDPQLDQFLAEHGEALVFDALETGGTTGIKEEKITGDFLENLLDPSLIRQLRKGSFEISLQPITNYVRRSKDRITDLRQIHICKSQHELSVTQLVSQFHREHRDTIEGFLKRQGNEMGIFTDARYIYFWFKERNSKVGQKVQDLVDALRYNLGVCFAQMVDKDTYRNLRDVTARWLAYAKAADFIAADQQIQAEVVPLFSETENPNGNKPARDLNFEAVRLIGKKVVNQGYGALYFRMIVRGLWMKGYFKEEKTESIGDRTGYGVEVEYIFPMNHYLVRSKVYGPLLDQMFSSCLNDSVISSDLKLDSALDCQNLGQELYSHIDGDLRNRIFTDLRPSEKGRPLLETGTHLKRILRLHVGIRREAYLQQMVDRYCQK